MSDTADDAAIYRIERAIRINRDPFPCENYEPASRAISLCANCGWDHSENKA